MANIQKFRAHESLNIESAANWQVQSIVEVDNLAAGSIIDVSNYHMVHLQPAEDIYFTFNETSAEASLSTANDLYLKGGDTIYSFKIPKGLANTMYLILERVDTTGNCRIVLS